MHARYYSEAVGRFLSADPSQDDLDLSQPQTWNSFTYVQNNPINKIDPDGRAAETVWDVANVVMDVTSLAGNVASGNVLGAVVDGVGLVVDVAATATPFVPGGAGTLIRTLRAGDNVVDGVRAVRGGESAAARAGRAAHKEFAERVKAKAAKGWRSEPSIKGPDGKTLRPDAITPSGRPVELKPNTPSGRRRGKAQIKKYEQATGKKGRIIYYDPKKIDRQQ